MSSQNISGMSVPGVYAHNISIIATQCQPSTCNMTMYAPMSYVPSLEGNVLYALLFMLFFFTQLIFLCIYRTWSYTVPMCLGLILEVVGYFGRIRLHYQPFNTNMFLVNIVALTIAPVFFTAAIYLTLARVIVHYGIHNSSLSPKAYSIIFMTSDFIALVLQSVGGGIADEATDDKGRNLGTHIMVAGLSFQVISLVLFMVLAAGFFLRVKKDRAQNGAMNFALGIASSPSESKSMRNFVWLFTVATIFILIRSAYRVAELAHGFSSKLANDQTTFMIFEGAMMAWALCIMTFYHPGRYIGRDAWKISGWGKSKKILEGKQISPAQASGEWAGRYGNGQQPTTKNYAANEGDIYMPLGSREDSHDHGQEQKVGLMQRVDGIE